MMKKFIVWIHFIINLLTTPTVHKLHTYAVKLFCNVIAEVVVAVLVVVTSIHLTSGVQQRLSARLK
jgi:hypothetical protein